MNIEVKPNSVAIVSEEDFEFVSKYNWSLNGRGYAYAAQRGQHSKGIFMHHLVIGKPNTGYEVHHIDGNKLNNTRENLEFVSEAYHQQIKGLQANNTSGYKGVCFVKSRNKWQASININGRTKLVGRFSTKEEAALAYDQEALKQFGPHAFFNFPDKLCQNTKSTTETQVTKSTNPQDFA